MKDIYIIVVCVLFALGIISNLGRIGDDTKQRPILTNNQKIGATILGMIFVVWGAIAVFSAT